MYCFRSSGQNISFLKKVLKRLLLFYSRLVISALKDREPIEIQIKICAVFSTLMYVLFLNNLIKAREKYAIIICVTFQVYFLLGKKRKICLYLDKTKQEEEAVILHRFFL